MPIFSIISSGSNSFGSPQAAVNARAQTYNFQFSGTWALNDTFGINIVTAVSTYKAAKGNLTQITPTAMLVLNDRAHMIAGTQWLGCDNGDPTNWDEQAPGAFLIETSDQFQTPQPLVALAPYQGMLALFGPSTILIWTLDANPDNITLYQVLANIGSIAALSAQPLGDLDVLYLHSSGIRSLRARVATLNAYVTDIGSPVDLFISGQNGILNTLGSQVSQSCATVEPNQNRYWLAFYEIDQMYVLSYFPANKIVAWSTYTPVDNAGDSFSVEKFLVYNGQVYLRALSILPGGYEYILIYGGSDNQTYDSTSATIQIPFYDEKKPGHKKYAQAFDIDLVGGPWTCYGSPDWVGDTVQELGMFSQASFDQGNIPFYDTGTHFSFKAVAGNTLSHPATVPTVTSIIFYYELGEQPC